MTRWQDSGASAYPYKPSFLFPPVKWVKLHLHITVLQQPASFLTVKDLASSCFRAAVSPSIEEGWPLVGWWRGDWEQDSVGASLGILLGLFVPSFSHSFVHWT